MFVEVHGAISASGSRTLVGARAGNEKWSPTPSHPTGGFLFKGASFWVPSMVSFPASLAAARNTAIRRSRPSRTAEGPSASPEEREASEELQKAKAQLKEEAGGAKPAASQPLYASWGANPWCFSSFVLKVAHVLSSTTRAFVTFWPIPASQNGRGGGISGLDHVAKKKLGDLFWPICLGSEFRMRTGSIGSLAWCKHPMHHRLP